MVMATGMQTADVSAAPEPAPAFEVRLMLAELAQRRGQDLKTELEALAAEQPNRPEPHVLYGYLLWRGGENRPEAEREFAAAFASGDRSPKMLWDYGRMIETTQPQESAEVFRQLLALQPDRAEVSIELAAALLAGGQPVEAARVLTSMPRVLDSGDAPRYFAVAAFVALGLGDQDQARVLAGKLMDAPKSSPADKQRAQQLLDSLK
jgi:predicted Zn-dependent protease